MTTQNKQQDRQQDKTGAQFTTVDDMSIRYHVVKAKGLARGRVLVLPGFTEFIEKHDDQIKRFNAMGLDALCLDWPSQGLSQRLSPGFPKLVHCDGFHQHLAALKTVMAETGFDGDDLPLLVFGHSMGGHLALRIAREMPTIKGVMLSAPMMLPPLRPARVIYFLLKIVCWLGLSKRPVFFRQDDLMKREFNPRNVLTRDPDGYQLQHDWFQKNPKLKVTGPSFGWAKAAYQSCFEVTANPSVLKQIDSPVDVHLAGDERVVNHYASARFAPYLPKAVIHLYPKARHELMLETPDVRALVWQRLEDFIEGLLGKG